MTDLSLSKASISAKLRWQNPEYRSKVSKSNSKPAKCPTCGEMDITKFYRNAAGNRKSAYCKDCYKIRCRDRWNSKTTLEKKSKRAIKYGITEQEYVKLHESQKGKCAICNEVPTTQRGLHTDHCHTTLKVRGLLCHGCNTGLGSFKDNVTLLNKAIEYLRSN